MILIFEVDFGIFSYTVDFNESAAMTDLKEFEEERKCNMDDLEVWTFFMLLMSRIGMKTR